MIIDKSDGSGETFSVEFLDPEAFLDVLLWFTSMLRKIVGA